jgi:hypothetical protein
VRVLAIDGDVLLGVREDRYGVQFPGVYTIRRP